jgi:hypothetical protein
VGLWTTGENQDRARERLASTGTSLVVGSLQSAIEQLRQTVQPLLVAPAPPTNDVKAEPVGTA